MGAYDFRVPTIFGCLRLGAFDFQLKFNLNSLILILKKINDLHSLIILGKKNVFLASKFLKFVSSRFAMPLIFYKQLISGILLVESPYD